MYRRRLVITHNGRLGLVPAATRKQDQVCVLVACSNPVIVRQVGNDHVLVGECYIHAVMNGEAVSEAQKEALTLEEFHII